MQTGRTEKEEAIRIKVKAALSPKRFLHVEGVVATADRLACLHGASPESARIAAWLHDYCREWPKEKLVQMAKEYNVAEIFFEVTELLHGHISAAMAPQEFGITDEDILNASRYHTSGRAGMSLLEKVVFLADAIEPGRRYPAVDELRRVAEEDLNLALALSYDNTIKYLLKRKQPIFPLTVVARNEAWQIVNDQTGQ